VAQPAQARQKLLTAAFAQRPASEGLVACRVRGGRWRATVAAADYVLQLRDGLTGSPDGHQIPRRHNESASAPHGSDAGATDAAVIQLNRLQFEYRCDAPAATDAEADRLDPGQRRASGVFPGDGPVRRCGAPLVGGRATALAQHPALGGDGEGRGAPA